MSDLLACACSADVYNEPGMEGNSEEDNGVIEVRRASRKAGAGPS